MRLRGYPNPTALQGVAAVKDQRLFRALKGLACMVAVARPFGSAFLWPERPRPAAQPSTLRRIAEQAGCETTQLTHDSHSTAAEEPSVLPQRIDLVDTRLGRLHQGLEG